MEFKKSILAVILISSFSFAGCETFKGAAQGFNTDVKNTYHNVTGKGNVIKKADDWVQQNLW